MRVLECPDIGSLVEQFTNLTLPAAAWTHKAHLRVGVWHRYHHAEDQAIFLLRERIRAFNTAVGTANTDSSGYHETLTRLYVLLISEALHSIHGKGMSDEAICSHVVGTLADRALPLNYFSRERLFSAYARRQWIEPDLGQIPQNRGERLVPALRW